jgi:hypothetical protein
LRTLLLCALAAALAGCSRRPALESSCISPNPVACVTAVRVPIERDLPKSSPSTTKRASTAAWHKPVPSFTRHAIRSTRTKLKSTNVATRAGAALVSFRSSLANVQTSAAAADSKAAQTDFIDSHLTVGVAKARTIQDQVAAATTVAERMSGPIALPGGLVAVVLTGPDIKSLSDLAGKAIAIDERYSASNGSVRAAVTAAGAFEVQLSEGQTTAINRLINKEVSAAVVALVAQGAADSFPDLAGFKTFQIPLLPRSPNR